MRHVIILSLAILSCVALAQDSYNPVEMPLIRAFPDLTNLIPGGVSANRSCTAWSNETVARPKYWANEASTSVPLKALVTDKSAYPRAISPDAGRAVGSAVDANDLEVPAVWTSLDSTSTPDPHLPTTAGYDRGQFTSVNDSDACVGWTKVGPTGLDRPLYFDGSGTDEKVLILPTTPSNVTNCRATWINASGVIVGWAEFTNLGRLPVSWADADSTPTVLTGWDYQTSGWKGQANYIADSGKIVGQRDGIGSAVGQFFRLSGTTYVWDDYCDLVTYGYAHSNVKDWEIGMSGSEEPRPWVYSYPREESSAKIFRELNGMIRPGQIPSSSSPDVDRRIVSVTGLTDDEGLNTNPRILLKDDNPSGARLYVTTEAGAGVWKDPTLITNGIERGTYATGAASDLDGYDELYYVITGQHLTPDGDHVRAVWEFESQHSSPTKLFVRYTGRLTHVGDFRHYVDVWNWSTSAWVSTQISAKAVTMCEDTWDAYTGSPGDFVDEGNNNKVRARFRIRFQGAIHPGNWQLKTDQFRLYTLGS